MALTTESLVPGESHATPASARQRNLTHRTGGRSHSLAVLSLVALISMAAVAWFFVGTTPSSSAAGSLAVSVGAQASGTAGATAVPTTTSTTTAPTPTTTLPPATTPPVSESALSSGAPTSTTTQQDTSGYGCEAAISYLQVHADPKFTIECPGNALGHEAMTCLNVAGVCENAAVIAIADPCPNAYMNEASNSWVSVGLSSAAIDPYGAC